MKYCVNITSSSLAGTLEDDNLRGEGRWERLIARGLLTIGEQVGTPLPKWNGDSPNWIGHIEDTSDCAYVAIYGGSFAPGALWNHIPPAAVYLFQFFSGPDAPIEAEMRQIIDRVGRKNLFLTHSYPSAATFARMAPDLQDRVAWLPMPVPEVTNGDHTQNTVLFFPARNIIDSLAADKGDVIKFVRSALLRNHRLTFDVLSRCTDNGESLWDHPLFRGTFWDLRDRVTVHAAIGHAEVQEIYARTRLVVCPCGYGGPPLESGRHGLPVVGLERDCSLYSAPSTPGFPEMPRLTGGVRFTDILGRLLYDDNYSRQVGNACRRYVDEHFSPWAFGRALGAIMDRR